MSTNRLMITSLTIFLLLGTISLAMGAAPTQSENQRLNTLKLTVDTTVPNGIYSTYIGFVGSFNESFDINNVSWAHIDAANDTVMLDSRNEYFTYNTLNSAYYEHKYCRVAISKGKIRSVWYYNSLNDKAEPKPSVNIPNLGLFNVTIRNVYSTSNINSGPMAYVIDAHGKNIGWVKIDARGAEGINIYNTLNSACLTHKKVTLDLWHGYINGVFSK